jgi:hypothetical protein
MQYGWYVWGGLVLLALLLVYWMGKGLGGDG